MHLLNLLKIFHLHFLIPAASIPAFLLINHLTSATPPPNSPPCYPLQLIMLSTTTYSHSYGIGPMRCLFQSFLIMFTFARTTNLLLLPKISSFLTFPDTLVIINVYISLRWPHPGAVSACFSCLGTYQHLRRIFKFITWLALLLVLEEFRHDAVVSLYTTTSLAFLLDLRCFFFKFNIIRLLVMLTLVFLMHVVISVYVGPETFGSSDWRCLRGVHASHEESACKSQGMSCFCEYSTHRNQKENIRRRNSRFVHLVECKPSMRRMFAQKGIMGLPCQTAACLHNIAFTAVPISVTRCLIMMAILTSHSSDCNKFLSPLK